MPPPLQTEDFWVVASYGYPNPFRTEPKALNAWAALRTFYDHDGKSYTALKAFWKSPNAPRGLDPHGIESWKQAFEEFGLLYVITRSDRISITPGGWQFFAAADRKNEDEFIWVGVNLIMRYPLQGPPAPRRAKSPAHRTSDLLPYRYLLSAMRDLDNQFWWAELNRVFCRVFHTADAASAVDLVRELRAFPPRHAAHPPAEQWVTGKAYNSLNQVPLHAGLNHTVITQDKDEKYGPGERPRHHVLNPSYIALVDAALGGAPDATGCGGAGTFVSRLPAAPILRDEQAYFDYVGAPVSPLAEVLASSGPLVVPIDGERVVVLRNGEYATRSLDGRYRVLTGTPAVLCRIALDERVILAEDLKSTYLVTQKAVAGPNEIRITLRQARPLFQEQFVQALLERPNG